MQLDIRTGIQEWNRWTREGWRRLPFVARSENRRKLPEDWRLAWEAASPYSVVLESGKGGRYTYLGLSPESVLTGKGDQADVLDLYPVPPPEPDSGEAGSNSLMKGRAQAEHSRSAPGRKEHGAPLEVLRRWMSDCDAPRPEGSGLPPFLGGAAGFLAYDTVRSLERLPVSALDDPGFPDYLWIRLSEVWIFDHEEEALYCAVHMDLPGSLKPDAPEDDSAGELESLYARALEHTAAMLALWDRVCAAPGLAAVADGPAASAEAAAGRWPGMRTAFPQDRFEQAVRDIKEYIAQGDVFQVNLSLRQEAQLKSPPEEVYEWLRRLNPSPYMGLLRSPGFALSSASPELLVKLHGDRVSARPIAGTRRRGVTPAEDAAMEAELRGSEKEIAEHIMLVDLERNDIGRVAAYGTVRVPELMTVERYSHVMHLVSQVEGRIGYGKDAYDVIAALFPGGTITGAPKVRTMEIIEELEPVRRGPYTGSMGWIDYGGNMELNIIIRTLAVQNGIGYIQTGAGVVIDSDPYREYRECHNKAKAVVAAVLCSEAAWEARAGSEEGGA